MADLATTYTLTSSGGSVVFNDGDIGTTTDLYWIDAIHGLDEGQIRATGEDLPFGDGGLQHKNWFGPMHPVFDGRLIIQSGLTNCQSKLDDLEEDLRAVLRPMIRSPYGTLAFTKKNGTSVSLTVQYEVTLDCQPADDYHNRSFNFGLYTPDPY